MHTIRGYPISILLFAAAVFAQGPPAQTAPQVLSREFNYINGKLFAMAKDFPADKYDYRPTKEMRTFGEVIVHVMSGNVYGAKAGRGEKVKWDELDPKNYAGKDAIVAAFEKSIADAKATLKEYPEGPAKNLQPWMSVNQHASEHYGLLVAYYRLNGLVPPDSRPKK